MTYREKLMIEYPEKVNDMHVGGCDGCPHHHFDDVPWPESCSCGRVAEECVRCWDREIPEEKEDVNLEDIFDFQKGYEAIQKNYEDIVNDAKRDAILKEQYESGQIDSSTGLWPIENPHILASGNRREFETGAVRDIQEGKGRCDLMPLDVVADWFEQPKKDPYPERTEMTYWVLTNIYRFQECGNIVFLHCALSAFLYVYDYIPTMFLECAKHFEEGAKKYGENNWQKGIPTHCYINSAVRHYLKFLRGDKDEPHDRAFVWNILCCIWTCKHKPELNDYAKTREAE